MSLIRRLRRTVRRRRARLNFHLRHRDIGLYLARACGLCLAATLVVGFSRPVTQLPPDQPTAGKPVAMTTRSGALVGPVVQDQTLQDNKLLPDQLQPAHRSDDDHSPRVVRDPRSGRVADGRSAVVTTAAEVMTVQPVDRPGSLAHGSIIDFSSGGIRNTLWLDATRDAAAAMTPTGLSAVLPGRFQGVGFPDIRRSLRASGSARADWHGHRQWRPLITWRALGEDESVREPIANVRCMGLTPQAVARRADRYADIILDTAIESGISVSLVKAIVTRESCFDSDAISPVGAQGLMQLMPETASWLKVTDPLDPMENLRAGIRYIARLRDQFGNLDLALAAYNAGPGNVRRYEGIPPFAETEDYVKAVKAHYRRYVAATQLASR